VKWRDLEDFLHRSRDPRELFRGRYTVIHTSGSSGETGFFVYDRAGWARLMAASAEGFRFLSIGRKRVAFLGATQGHFAGVTMSLSTSTLPFSLIYQTRVFEVNRPLAEAVRGLNQFQPHIVTGYGTALKALAEKQRQGELHIRPESIISSGEALLEADRTVIESVFGRCVKNLYACSEFGLMGVREPSWQSMRLLEDSLIFEIEPDHTVVTNLSNRVLPLIRYRMNDVLSLLPSLEHSPYRAITDVVGRVEQLAKFRNRRGEIDGISPHTINEILIPCVRRFQMRILGLESFCLAVVFDSSASALQKQEALAIARRNLAAILREKEMDNVTFDVTAVDDLPVDSKSGKFRLIVSQGAEEQTSSLGGPPA
jgi:phenylacetate-coenzyme A ligase PaaK-like adenylate-forming protein